jgi:hypothetical protein
VTSKGPFPLDALIVSQRTNYPIGYPKNAGPCPKKIKPVSASIVRPSGSCLRIFVSAIASKTRKLISAAALPLSGEFIAVLFDGRDEALAVPTDSVRKVSTRQS